MQYEEFIESVKAQSTLINTKGEAEVATRATLKTLAENLAWTEVDRLSAQLPKGLKEYLQPEVPSTGQQYSLEEFYQKVGDRENLGRAEVVNHVSAVMQVFQSAISQGELNHIRAQLSSEYNLLFSAR